ncbi:MAG: SPOR domain-containing protein, partial [Alcanivorax nanhaiticus]
EPTMEPVARLEDLESREAPTRQEGGVILEPVADPVMQSDPPPKDSVMVLEEKASDDEPVEAPPQEKAGVAEEPLVDDKGYQHAGWLASLGDDRWFLQITATSQQEGARRVLDDVQRKGAYYEAERNGKTVWLVLSGDYSSRQAALDAKASLPAKLREAGPFPRKMGDIRSEL